MNNEMVRRFRAFITERHAIHTRRESGQSKPWTDDPILRMYRFCNVCREWDTETRWISQFWRHPHKNDPDLWFAMLVARVFNWRETLAEIKYPVPWDDTYRYNVLKVVRTRMDGGLKVWTGAYIVSTNGHKEAKHDYFVYRVFDPAWTNRDFIRPTRRDTLASFATRLMTLNGVSNFMAGQIIADLKFVGHLAHAEDWFSWCTPGPGSMRGLNRIYGFELGSKWSASSFMDTVNELRKTLDYHVTKNEVLTAQDLQNCLCEFDKYERVRLGEGRPRSLYNGG